MLTKRKGLSSHELRTLLDLSKAALASLSVLLRLHFYVILREAANSVIFEKGTVAAI
jgi:hypothetical protein